MSSPVLARDGTIYVVASKQTAGTTTFVRRLVAIGPDGMEKWSVALDPSPNGGPYTPSAAVGLDGAVYVVDGGHVRAYSNAGAALWVSVVDAYGEPAIGSDGTIYAGSSAIKPSGETLWTHPQAGSAGSIALGDDGTVFVTAGHTITASRPDGAVIWTVDVSASGAAGAPLCTPLSAAYLSSPVVAADGLIWMGYSSSCPDMNWGVVAFSPSGAVVWDGILGKSPLPDPSIGQDGKLHFGTLVVTPMGGAQVSLGDLGASPAIGPDGAAYFGLYATKADGTPLWGAEGSSVQASDAPAIGADGTLYVPCTDGTLRAMGR